MEHLSKFSKVYFKQDEEAKAWLAKQKIALFNNKIEQFIQEIKDLSCSKSANKERLKQKFSQQKPLKTNHSKPCSNA